MAAKAFLLIVTATGKSSEVVTSLSKLKGVISVDTVTGPYDFVKIPARGQEFVFNNTPDFSAWFKGLIDVTSTKM